MSAVKVTNRLLEKKDVLEVDRFEVILIADKYIYKIETRMCTFAYLGLDVKYIANFSLSETFEECPGHC